ncbi:MAG: glycosyltransferase [Elusimicrobia bacterium]|nr:glycosyltransferase [Elusimicrobiota bacterium]
MTQTPFDVVVLSSVEWDAAWQRHHAFAAQWAAAGRRVFFVENAGLREPGLRDLGRVARRLRRLAAPALSRMAPPPDGVSVVSPLVLPPTRPAFRRLNAALLIPRLIARLRGLGLRGDPVVFAYLPTASTLSCLEELQPALTVYDCVDNFYGLPRRPPDLAETETALLKRAGLVLTTSRTLHQEKKRLHPNVLELHHGVGEAFFLPPPPPRPPRRLVYFGTLWRALDYAPIRALAQAGFDVELIGPVKEAAPPLPPSARLRGPVAHAELPALLAGADALLLPYADDEYNRGVIPAKTYECLATGRPVLASPLPALTAVPELAAVLTFARAPEEWVAAARALADDDARARAARVSLARAHAENACFTRLRQAVEDALHAR